MPQININTSQNVQIGYATANVGVRILAQLIDILLLSIYIMLFIATARYFNFNSYVLTYIVFLPVAFYSFIMEALFQGQSFGKMLLKIKVVKLDGSQGRLLNYFIRWMFRLVDVSTNYGVVAIISVAVSSKGQRLGDMAAGTTVVNLKKKQDFKYSIYQTIADDYELQFAEVEKLTEADIKTVIEVLKVYDSKFDVASRSLLSKTKKALQTKMGINDTLSDYEFLKTIIQDYNYLARNYEF